MYERFSDRARKVMQFANQEAQNLCHEYIGTEHILLGVAKSGDGVATRVLTSLGATADKMREGVLSLVQRGPEMVTMGKLPQTPRAKKVIELAMDESRSLGHNYVGTEHITLGLLREQEGASYQVLNSLGVTADNFRDGILELLSPKAEVAMKMTAVLYGPLVRIITVRQVQDGPNSSKPVHETIDIRSEALWKLLREKGAHVIGACIS